MVEDLKDMVILANDESNDSYERVQYVAEYYGYMMCQYKGKLNLKQDRELKKFYDIVLDIAKGYSISEKSKSFLDEMIQQDSNVKTY